MPMATAGRSWLLAYSNGAITSTNAAAHFKVKHFALEAEMRVWRKKKERNASLQPTLP